MKLYEISEEYRRALEQIEIDPETGEVLNMAALEAVQGEFQDKAEAQACYYKEKRAEAEAIKAEKQALDKRQKSAERAAEWMLGYLARCMAAVGQERITTPRCAISWRKTSAVKVEDEERLPAKYMRIKAEPNKTEIKRAIQAGEVVPGAVMEEGRALQVK